MPRYALPNAITLYRRYGGFGGSIPCYTYHIAISALYAMKYGSIGVLCPYMPLLDMTAITLYALICLAITCYDFYALI
jgi:hypothetical protein